MTTLAFAYGNVAYVALAVFLVAVGLGLGWAFFRLAATFDRLSSLIRGTEREVLPVINKVGGSVDRVNAQLDKLDQVTDSAAEAVEAGYQPGGAGNAGPTKASGPCITSAALNASACRRLVSLHFSAISSAAAKPGRRPMR